MNFNSLKDYCRKIVPLTDKELELIDLYFESRVIDDEGYLLAEGEVCNFVAFIAEGSIRHFQRKEGKEITCDITSKNGWVTDFLSFTYNTPGSINLQAQKKAKIFLVRKENLLKMYEQSSRFETIGRHMAEEVAGRAVAMSMRK